MVAVHAKRAVFTALSGVPGVTSAEVELGRAVVEHDARTTAEALADAPGKSLLKREEVPSAFMAERLVEVLNSARHEVLRSSPYFVPGKGGMEWFKETCARGV